MIELGVGFFLGFLTIVLARKQNMERWFYTACLLFLPAIYMLFGVLAEADNVILKEFLFGLPYFIAGAVCLKLGFKYSGYVVALLWFVHGLYDLVHPQLFVNSGVPGWYPVMCAGFDMVVGVYLVYLVRGAHEANIKTIGATA